MFTLRICLSVYRSRCVRPSLVVGPRSALGGMALELAAEGNATSHCAPNALTDSFGWFIQFLLAGLAFASLISELTRHKTFIDLLSFPARLMIGMQFVCGEV